jgi:hypothetical protein
MTRPLFARDDLRFIEGIAPNGEAIVSVVFGMTFHVARDGSCEPKSPSVADSCDHRKANVASRYTKPSLLVRDTDLMAWKNLTDLVVQGVARSEKAVTQLSTELEVRGGAEITRAIAINGDRFIDKIGGALVLSDAARFHEMALTYENAFGGTDEEAEEAFGDVDQLNFYAKSLEPDENEELSAFSYARNPAGKGYLVDEVGAIGTPWPNLEFPDDRLSLATLIRPLEQWGDCPMPASFDWFPHAWFPRVAFFDDFPATHDGKIPERERRLGLFEPGFEDLHPYERPKHPFANGAHPYLARHRFAGSEILRVTKVSTDGRDFGVKLPGWSPEVAFRLLAEPKVVLKAALDTVFVETEKDQVTLVWRASHFTRRTLPLPFDWDDQSEASVRI